jgi:flagellar basal-body rod protein FlgF
MENTLLIGLSRQVALARELDVVANNVANVDTNGFKRRGTIFQEHLAPSARHEHFKPGADRRLSYVWDRGTALQYSQGSMERTGNPMDVAIQGDAMFAVRSGAGGERYTRNGSLGINARGELVNSDGHPMITDQGTLTVAPTETDLKIAADGSISTSNGPRGRLKLVAVPNPQALRNEISRAYQNVASLMQRTDEIRRSAIARLADMNNNG